MSVQLTEVLLELCQRVPVEAQLVDDVLGQVALDPVDHPGLTLRRLQQLGN